MEITVTSRETIKPSSPTPPHLRHLPLSLLDQNTPTIFIRILFFYSSRGDPHRFRTSHTSGRLKKSLSAALAEFYPAAGALDGKRSIRCNDGGLEYIEARVPSPLSRLLACPKAEELARLVPYEEYNEGTGFEGLSAVQVTVFEECGGMAIGVSMSHRVADASSVAAFVDRWGAIARGDLETADNKVRSAEFGYAHLFPPVDHAPEPEPEPVPQEYNNDNECAGRLHATRRFVFPQMKIDALKASYTYESPTRVEAVSALILKCLMNASKLSSKPIVICMGINVRSRLSPPLPARSFGNIVLVGRMDRISPESSLNDLGVQIREIIKELTSDYLEKLRANNAALLIERTKQQVEMFLDNEIRILPTTSWCRFPWYDVDIGWGKPTWVAPVYLSSQDSFMLIDAKNGDGIEAWVTLDENDMARFESDDKLLDFACLNPVVSE